MEDFLWRMRVWASVCLRKCCWCCGDKTVRREEKEEMFEMRVEEIKETIKTEEKPSKTWSVSSLPVAEVRWVCVVCVCVRVRERERDRETERKREKVKD